MSSGRRFAGSASRPASRWNVAAARSARTPDAMSQPYGSAYEKSIHQSWHLYERTVRVLRGRAQDPAFAARGYVQGLLDPAIVAAVRAALQSADFMLLDADDSRPGFRRSEKVRKVGKILNAGHRYYRLGAAQLSALGRMLE